MIHPSYPRSPAPGPIPTPHPLIKSGQLSTAKVKALSLQEWVGRRRRGSLHIPCGRRQSQTHIPGKSGWSEFFLNTDWPVTKPGSVIFPGYHSQERQESLLINQALSTEIFPPTINWTGGEGSSRASFVVKRNLDFGIIPN